MFELLIHPLPHTLGEISLTVFDTDSSSSSLPLYLKFTPMLHQLSQNTSMFNPFTTTSAIRYSEVSLIEKKF